MEDRTFDALTRRAALGTLGVAGWTTLVGPTPLAARNRNKNRKRKKGNVNALCERQVGECTDFIATGCETDPADCLAASGCCPILDTCDFLGFINCLLALTGTSVATGRPGTMPRRSDEERNARSFARP